MGPLQLMVTWCKKHLAGQSTLRTWTSKTKKMKLHSLLSSKVFFVPCDCWLQRAHLQGVLEFKGMLQMIPTGAHNIVYAIESRTKHTDPNLISSVFPS